MNLTHSTIDNTLRDFYRSEMPAPWPMMRAPARTLPLRKHVVRPMWVRSLSRCAMAASIALLLVGYLALASLFPQHTGAGSGLNPATGEIGEIRGKSKQLKPLIQPVNQRPRDQRRGATITDDFPGGFTVTPLTPEPRR